MFASCIEFIKRIIGIEGSYMEKKYSKKEHDKCQRVADAFSELYEMYGDMCVVDAGKFGFAFLKWYGGESFDGNSVYQDSKELFDDLWQMWLDYKILDSVAGTEREDIDYKKLYEELSAETQKEYEEKRQQFLRLSGLCD